MEKSKTTHVLRQSHGVPAAQQSARQIHPAALGLLGLVLLVALQFGIVSGSEALFTFAPGLERWVVWTASAFVFAVVGLLTYLGVLGLTERRR